MKWLAAILSCMLLSVPALAREITPAERRETASELSFDRYNANLPACADPSVLGNISHNFEHKEAKFWNTNVRIIGFERVQEVAFRPWGLDYIPRRYCSGTVIVSDGFKRRVNFSIGEDMGFIGIGWGADYCIDGFDRNYAYAPHCKQALP
ncbi:hypothetical protein AB4Y85_02790 [Microvirga sp. 2YAF29]|uniref:hypothetical protein n=1 Tax=Microvirga sp. 2YAF29 TaxID=3233031 RepID=UPI003F9BB705